ncbi:MAG TPA: glycosyltransferase family 2 protein [Actinopolymorphaceae bacterium]
MTVLRSLLRIRDNDHAPYVSAFTERTGIGWHDKTPPQAVQAAGSVSVVIPAYNAASTIAPVLTALHRQRTTADLEVIVVDDGSTDHTAELVSEHPIPATVIRFEESHGISQARNAGTAVASGDVVLYLDSDIVLPAHAIHDIATRARDDCIFLGFRADVSYDDHQGGRRIPDAPAPIEADARAYWRKDRGRRLVRHTGEEIELPDETRMLDATDDLIGLGFGRRYLIWTLVETILGHTLAVARERAIDVGGFHPGFRGWGCEDSHFGAKLIASGVKVVPLRQVVSYHLQPRDVRTHQRRKLAAWASNLALYRRLLDEPFSSADGRRQFARNASSVLRTAAYQKG